MIGITSQTTGLLRHRGKPLLPVCGVASIVECTNAGAVQLIEEGNLAWAWDLATRFENSKRRIIRVLPECVSSFLAGETCPLDLNAVLGLMFPGAGEAVRAADVSWVMNITSDTLYELTDRHELEAVTTRRRGRQGTAQIGFESLRAFLQRRKYPKQTGCGRSLKPIITSQTTDLLPHRRKPLLSVCGVASIVARNRAGVVQLIKDGKLPWAWDLAPWFESSKRTIRVLPECVSAFLSGEAGPLDLDAVLELMFPGAGETVRAADISRVMNIRVDSLYNLVDRNELEALTTRSRGWRGTAQIGFESLKAFLQRRRYPKQKDKQTGIGRPLIRLAVAAGQLSCKVKEVLCLIEEGRITRCFNVGIKPGFRRLRILPLSLDEFKGGYQSALEWEDVLALLLSADRPAYSNEDVCRLLGITVKYLKRLVLAKELVPTSASSAAVGEGQGITVGSLEAFLFRRRYPLISGKERPAALRHSHG